MAGEYLRVAFLGKDEKTKKLVEEVNKLFGSEQRLVVAITGDTASRIEERVEDNTRKIEEIGESMTKVLGTLKGKPNSSGAVAVLPEWWRSNRPNRQRMKRKRRPRKLKTGCDVLFAVHLPQKM
jgi:hypothetical protein